MPEFKARISYKESPFLKRKEPHPCWYEVCTADSGSQGGHLDTVHGKVSSSQAAKALQYHPCHEEFALKSMEKRESFPSPVLKSSVIAWDLGTNA